MALALLILTLSLTLSLISVDIDLWSPDDQAQGRCSFFYYGCSVSADEIALWE